MVISPGVFFFIFSKFLFSGLLGESTGKKWPKMTKISACRTLHTSYDHHLRYAYVKGLYLHALFTFFPNFNFQRQW